MRRVVALCLLAASSVRADPPTEAPPWLPRVLQGRVTLEGPGGEDMGFENFRRAGGTTLDLGGVGGFQVKLRVAGGDRLAEPASFDPTIAASQYGPLWGGASLTFSRGPLQLGLSWTMSEDDPLGRAAGFFHEVLFRIRIRF